jgi:hypothetical protein
LSESDSWVWKTKWCEAEDDLSIGSDNATSVPPFPPPPHQKKKEEEAVVVVEPHMFNSDSEMFLWGFMA